MRNITLLGDDSLLGLHVVQDLRANKDLKLQSLGAKAVDISDAKAIRQLLRKQDIVINGIELADPDEAERNRKEAFRINSDFPRELAHTCSNLKVRLVQLSTPYVFDGSKDSKYNERDIPNPINIYGSSKFVAEKEVRAVCPDALVIRLGPVFGGPRQGGHFLHELFARLKAGEKDVGVIDNQLVAPAYAAHVAPLLQSLILGDRTGLAHVGPDESCTWYEFAQAALTLAGLDPLKIHPATAAMLALPAARPANLVMDSFWLRQWTGMSVPGWREGLRAAFS
jgi:dTDP-4-dehydrorhamnose reductase